MNHVGNIYTFGKEILCKRVKIFLKYFIKKYFKGKQCLLNEYNNEVAGIWSMDRVLQG